VAVTGWVVDNSVAARENDAIVRAQLTDLAGTLYKCPIGQLEQFYSARSAQDYGVRSALLHGSFRSIPAPINVFERTLRLKRHLVYDHERGTAFPFPIF
jgi:hypothetical protein